MTSALLKAATDDRLELIDDVAEGEWTTYVEGHPEATADHAWGWRHVIEGVFGQRCRYVGVRRNGTLAGVLPLAVFDSRLFGRSLVSLPYLNYGGVLASDSASVVALTQAAAEVATQVGASHVELRHRRRQAPDLPVRQHKVGMSLALPATADELWKALDRKVRNQIRKSQKEQLAPTSGGMPQVAEFYDVFARNMRDLGTPVYSRRLFDETLRIFADRAEVHIVRYQGRPVAGAVSLRFRDTVLVPWASSLREFRALCPNMLLYWQMLQRSIEQGAAVFDFGRSTRDSGPHHFKQQWRASETPLQWEYILRTVAAPPDQGPSNRKLALAIEAWKRLPLWVTNRLGPVIARHIP